MVAFRPGPVDSTLGNVADKLRQPQPLPRPTFNRPQPLPRPTFAKPQPYTPGLGSGGIGGTGISLGPRFPNGPQAILAARPATDPFEPHQDISDLVSGFPKRR